MRIPATSAEAVPSFVELPERGMGRRAYAWTGTSPATPHTMRSSIHLPAVLLAALTALSAPLTALAEGPDGPASERVVQLTGWLQTYDLSFSDVVVHVVLEDGGSTTTVNDRGRFEVNLPADVEAVLRIEKPGHVTKEVVVDTRHASTGSFDDRVRKVSFGVVLEPERHMADLTYAGPVGTITFDADGGCLAVEQHRTVMPTRRQATMVF